MNRQRKWDLRYLELANLVASWSKDPSTKVGAVLVRPNNSVAATGFNGFPPGADDSPERYADRDLKYRHVVHAEVNALNFFGQPAQGFTLYTSFPYCPNCLTYAARRGVTRIVQPPLPTLDRGPEWIREWQERQMEAAARAVVRGIHLETL